MATIPNLHHHVIREMVSNAGRCYDRRGRAYRTREMARARLLENDAYTIESCTNPKCKVYVVKDALR